MKIALIGATGFVGTPVLAELLSRGHQVTVLARNPGKLAAQPGLTVVAADALDARLPEFCGLLVKEAHKTLGDCVAEVREAVDFCRYYAHLAERQFGAPEVLKGPVGETNTLRLAGRGVFVCISPWNFPLAIFVGQCAAALAATAGRRSAARGIAGGRPFLLWPGLYQIIVKNFCLVPSPNYCATHILSYLQWKN